jgi:hypothetical protein
MMALGWRSLGESGKSRWCYTNGAQAPGVERGEEVVQEVICLA